MVKLSGGGRFFLLPATADPRLVPGETIVGLVQPSAGGSSSSAGVSAAACAAAVSQVLTENPPCKCFWRARPDMYGQSECREYF